MQSFSEYVRGGCFLGNGRIIQVGVEPSGVGFVQATFTSRKLESVNDIDPERILNSVGEELPFPDDSFDIVYFANLRNTLKIQTKVLREAMRVLRPEGQLFIEIPNFLL